VRRLKCQECGEVFTPNEDDRFYVVDGDLPTVCRQCRRAARHSDYEKEKERRA